MDVSYIINQLGEEPEKYFGAVSPPVVQTSNFCFPTVSALRQAFQDEETSYLYTRGNNPTTEILRKKLAALAGAEDCLVFSSGVAAVTSAVMNGLKQGDHVVCVDKPYSWTKKLLTEYLPRFGVHTTFVDGRELKHIEKALTPHTRLIYLESPNSFTFELQDIETVCTLARSRNIRTVLDNSYCTSLGQQAIALGVDLEVHSGTKYYGGHSDVVCGIVLGSRQLIADMFRQEFMGLGGILGPHESWLMIRSLRTLPIRMQQIRQTTEQVVAFLHRHPKVEKILYPFLPDFPQYELARRQMQWCGGLFSVYFREMKRENVERFCEALQCFRMAVSWGGHESLIMPAVSFYPEDAIPEPPHATGMIRFYIGLETPELLIADIQQALVHLV